MAKKKASAKKAKKAAPKKAAKKAPVKKKATSTVKKAGKTPAKKAKPVKVTAKKTVKKVKKNTVKAPAKSAATKPGKKAATGNPHLVKTTPKKAVDLSQFVTPLDDRLIVQVSGEERMTPGGLYIPDTVADTSGNLHGTVVAVGRGHVTKKGHLKPMDVRVGDKVVFTEYSGSKIKLQNEDLIILRESELMGVLAK